MFQVRVALFLSSVVIRCIRGRLAAGTVRVAYARMGTAPQISQMPQIGRLAANEREKTRIRFWFDSCQFTNSRLLFLANYGARRKMV
jgi:hypothetical protein